MAAVPRTTFLSLPTELRLQIATYALDQSDEIIIPECWTDRLDSSYSSAVNLSLLLVCRQFHRDFKNVAYQMTTFVLVSRKMQAIGEQPNTTLQNLRKLVIETTWDPLLLWQNYPFDHESLHLDELCIVTSDQGYHLAMDLLHRLRNVKKLRIFPADGNYHVLYARLVGAMQKDDHYQRYDAPDAPNIGCTWWDPCYNAQDISFDLVARDPVPPLAEEAYMIMMKPKVDELMEWLAQWL